jgi:hypothetical protein
VFVGGVVGAGVVGSGGGVGVVVPIPESAAGVTGCGVGVLGSIFFTSPQKIFALLKKNPVLIEL